MSDLTLIGDPDRSPFDRIRHVRADGSEFWSARELGSLIGYLKWQNLREAVDRAMAAARNAKSDVDSAFTQVIQVTGVSNLGPSEREDFQLTRYAAYLVAMNGDPRKSEVAKAQAYFAIQTRIAETTSAPRELSRLELIDLARDAELSRIEAESRAEAETVKRELAEARVAEIEPAADAWTALASAEGDYSVREAAQALSRAGHEIGQRRLFELLRQLKWCDRGTQAYQAQIGAGNVAMLPHSYRDPASGRTFATEQLRVTVKGLDRLRRIIGGDA